MRIHVVIIFYSVMVFVLQNAYGRFEKKQPTIILCSSILMSKKINFIHVAQFMHAIQQKVLHFYSPTAVYYQIQIEIFAFDVLNCFANIYIIS